MKKGSHEFIPIGNAYLKHICCNCYLFCPIADIQYELLKYDFRNMALETVSNCVLARTVFDQLLIFLMGKKPVV